MTRQVTDQLYIDLGYFTPENYFVYQANAQLTAASTATITVSIGVIKAGASTQTATANISCDAVRLRTQSADASLSASASFSSNAVKTVDVQSTQSAEFALSGSAGRIQQGQGSFTGAFSPTLTVEVIKNHTAILDVIFSVTTVGVANRATAITTSTIAALDAQAVKTVDVVSNHASTATISTQAVTTKSATSTLTNTATLSCNALNVQFASASLSVGSSIFTTRYFGVGRPFDLTRTGGGAITFTTDSKFGSYALLDDVVVAQKGLPLINGYDKNQMVVQGWIKPLDTNSTGSFIIPGISVGGPFDLRKNGATVRFTTYYNFGGNRTQGNEFTSPSFTANNWYHWALVFNGTNVAFFWNGSRAGPIGGVVDLWNSSVLNDSFRIIARSGDWILDEISIHKDTTLGYDPTSSTITVPTSAGTNNDSTTLALWHFENNGLDDTTIGNQTGSATLSSTASISAQAIKTSSGSASLSSQSTVSVIGSLLNVAQASLTSTATVSAVIGTLESAQSASASAFTSQIQAQKTTDITSSQSAQVSTQVDQIRIRNFAGAFTGAFTPTLTIDVLKNHTAVLDAVSTVTAQVNGQFDSLISISAQATLTTTVTVIEQGASDLAATVTLSAQATRLPSSGSVMSAEATLSAVIGYVKTAVATINSTVTLAISADRRRGYASNLTAQATWVETIPAVYRNLGDQTLTATATVSAFVTNRIGFNIAVNATAAMATVAVITTENLISITAASTQSTVAVKTVNPSTAFSSIATQLTGIGYNATGTILLESTASLTAIIGSIKQYVGSSISGVKAEASTNRYAKLASGASVYNQPGITMAIWARRDDLNPSRAVFWSTDLSGYSLARFEYVNQTTARFSVGSFGFVETWNWNNSVPYDNLWHHYIVRIKRTGLGPVNGFDEMELWVDGEYKGLRTNSQGFAIYNWSVFGPINLGFGPKHQNEATGPYYFDGDLAQIWIGDWDNFILSSIWNNGPIDLGPTGINDGFLPAPAIYSPLNQPWTNITFYENNVIGAALGADQALDLPDMTVKASLSAGILGVFLYGSNLTATTTLTCAGNFTAGAASALSTQATVVAQPVVQTGIVAQITAQSTLSADVNLAPAGGAVLADHQATLECQAGYLRSQSSTQSAQATMTTEAMVIPPVSGDAALTVFVSQTTVAGYLINAVSTHTAIFTQVTEGTEILPIQASGTLQVDTALTCEITRVRPGISLEMSAGTLTCDATVIPPIRTGADLASVFTMSVAVSGIFDTITLTASMGTITITPVKTARITATLTATTTVIATPFKRTGIVAVLSAQGFILTAGDVINIDPYLTLRIRPESRQITVEAETRTIRILPESRTLTIEGYTI